MTDPPIFRALVGVRSPAQRAWALALLTLLPAAAGAQEAGEGERLFRQRCASCHATQAGQNRGGPSLAGIAGRRAGSGEGARYSSALRESGLTWDDASLDRFLANPRQTVPGTTMAVNVPNESQRQSLIAFLRSLP
ncbi:c-type cytochrome [Plastoroseomonas hellenica]|uniref:c-type cytochrome n=1 Tax=Plastoroseomonas hellenica TaxID=2687306 RepID=UPI001BA96D8D|nr:c-type cytochrome [Plastoroseomonas hellenica]MBR0645327.1 c-type cytochrome [Plastoroseomonas hellenica]